MYDEICPYCDHRNERRSRYCNQCGESLPTRQLIIRRPAELSLLGRSLPAPQLKQVGQALAVGLATLAADAALAWLRRRVAHIGTPEATPPPVRDTAVSKTAVSPTNAGSFAVTLISQRITEVWRRGRLVERVVEQAAWQRDDS